MAKSPSSASSEKAHISDFIPRLFNDFDELHGDRQFADDASIIGGLASFEDIPVMIVGHGKEGNV